MSIRRFLTLAACGLVLLSATPAHASPALPEAGADNAWSTTDDYWNPAATRQSWKDLPQGRPEAQAAYQSGYNGGKDQFGRTVANPAGIDLGDGEQYERRKATT